MECNCLKLALDAEIVLCTPGWRHELRKDNKRQVLGRQTLAGRATGRLLKQSAVFTRLVGAYGHLDSKKQTVLSLSFDPGPLYYAET
ncbi:hypothetical protein RRG08_006592 [Elysia crispata]|uniref:Uncharacterized protein n=1 Tax=Elysia crispata TaxID=231223 RepID=A0AAE0YEK4_9GAST|nr:hypothetical protein RRG08_006592 [Elysia crispata]